MNSGFRRVVLAVLDGVGIGEMPDAGRFGDGGSDTLGHVLAYERPKIPHLAALGLAGIRPLPGVEAVGSPLGSFGKAAIQSDGKDTTVGHWEMAGIISRVPFPTYPEGFPARILEPFEKALGLHVLGNRPASGTEIIEQLGDEHVRTGRPIVYTSADSVFQIAAHERVVPLKELYRMCEIARRLLDGPDRVSRVIARPFVGSSGSYRRTANRRDFAVPPPEATLLDALKNSGSEVVSVGKVASIFDGRGITSQVPSHSNEESMDGTLSALARPFEGLIFANFGDFDTLWGHRNDPAGFAGGLQAFDRRLPELYAALRQDDCLILTADHGCDPLSPGTDHTREYVPILVFSPGLAGGVDIGTRSTLADMGQTVAENFGLSLDAGESFLKGLK
ncbi:MAG: phosphopentomutase [Acidobacteria bacterium]|nr:phosphopentomutase [Acidobacteriota bacterium]